jgi:hypothetical protein
LQDAYTLAWKLALVIKKRATPALLDSYEQERIPVAKALLSGTDRAFRIVVSDSWALGLLRTKVLSRIAAFAVNRKAMQRIAFRTVSQTGIRYPKSSLSKSLAALPETAPKAGDRFPWLRLRLRSNGPVEDLLRTFSDTHFHLVLIGQPPAPDRANRFGSLLEKHVIPAGAENGKELARAQIPQPSFYLIRPDGYIGLCGKIAQADEIAKYAEKNLQLEAQFIAKVAT